MKSIHTDLLIVGGGGAGLRAAIEASNYLDDVTIAVKGLLGRSGATIMAEGGLNSGIGITESKDNPDYHFRDTIKGGYFLNDQELVRFLCNGSQDLLVELEQFGVIFDREEDGQLKGHLLGGHTYPRTYSSSDRSGQAVMKALISKMRETNVQVLEDVMIYKLIEEGSRIIGAIGYDLTSGELLGISAKSIILATGGLGQLYNQTSNPEQKTGDGYAMALEVGAELVDMEFVQFHPTGMAYPESMKGLLVTESARGRGGVLLNTKGERFMERYDPEKMELATRDVVARAIYREVEEGRGTDHNGVYLDISHLDDKIIDTYFDTVAENWELAGIDIKKEPMEVYPTCHHFMGGLRINSRCETTIPNLYTCGETAGGVHGANRLGGNGVIETQVFGKVAGREAAKAAQGTKLQDLDPKVLKKEEEIINTLIRGGRRKTFSPLKVERKIRKLMWEKASIIRNEERLSSALEELEKMGSEIIPYLNVNSGNNFNFELTKALEVENMLKVGKMVVKAGLFRKESRGAHTRVDFPETRDEYFHNIVLSKNEKGEIKLKVKEPNLSEMRPDTEGKDG